MNKKMKKSSFTFSLFEIQCVTPKESEKPPLRSSTSEALFSPLPRSGHRMICIGSDLYVFGGYNNYIVDNEFAPDAEYGNQDQSLFKELWKFNTISQVWCQLKNLDGMPKELASHSAVACCPYMVVYGGTATPFGQASSNSVHLCRLPRGTWTKLDTHGFSPLEMYGQAVCREKDELFVIGGTTGYEYNLDVHVLNLTSLKWKYLISNVNRNEVSPDRRYRHEIVYHAKSLLVFGGGTNSEAFSLDSLPTYDLEGNYWRLTETHPDPVVSEFPKPRKCHVLVKYKQNVYIQGGTSEVEHLNDFWRLDLNTMTWRRLPGTTEKPIYFHSGAVTQEGGLYLFGGIWESEKIRTNKIFKVNVDVPSLRTIAWQAVDYYAPGLMKLPRSKLLELGIPPSLVESIKLVVCKVA